MSEQRVTLTYILLDLLDQQKARRHELLDTLNCLESQRENEQRDFWLLQYQKLLDSQPGEESFKSNSIDPMLGYNFLVNGVVHCIPFLSRLWQSHKCNIMDITDNDLIEAGIKNASDREKILQSIKDFLKLEQPQTKQAISVTPSSPPTGPTQSHEHAPNAPPTEQSTSKADETSGEIESECVICMEESVSSLSICLDDFWNNCGNSLMNKKFIRFTVQNHIPTVWSPMLLSQLPYINRRLPNVSSVHRTPHQNHSSLNDIASPQPKKKFHVLNPFCVVKKFLVQIYIK